MTIHASLIAFLFLAASAFAAVGQPVKVFILAGQSNMEGKAPNALFEHQATDAKTADLFAHLRKDGQWFVRDDVFIKFLDRKSALTVGYGSPGRTGAELEFGTIMGNHFMGNHFSEPVVLIKAAWGGHSLYKLFRSPSAGFPTEAVLENSTNIFPELKGRTPELAGFVWFQGWNDQYGAENKYASNMRRFIADVRRDLKVPKLPFVIAAMGQNGSKPPAGAMLTIREAQLAMNDVPEFKGNVKAFRTDLLVGKAAEEFYPTWKQNEAQWKLVGLDGDNLVHLRVLPR